MQARRLRPRQGFRIWRRKWRPPRSSKPWRLYPSRKSWISARAIADPHTTGTLVPVPACATIGLVVSCVVSADHYFYPSAPRCWSTFSIRPINRPFLLTSVLPSAFFASDLYSPLSIFTPLSWTSTTPSFLLFTFCNVVIGCSIYSSYPAAPVRPRVYLYSIHAFHIL